MHCVKCGSEALRKNGIVHSRQRYLCKACGYNWTVEQKRILMKLFIYHPIPHNSVQGVIRGKDFNAVFCNQGFQLKIGLRHSDS